MSQQLVVLLNIFGQHSTLLIRILVDLHPIGAYQLQHLYSTLCVAAQRRQLNVVTLLVVYHLYHPLCRALTLLSCLTHLSLLLLQPVVPTHNQLMHRHCHPALLHHHPVIYHSRCLTHSPLTCHLPTVYVIRRVQLYLMRHLYHQWTLLSTAQILQTKYLVSLLEKHRMTIWRPMTHQLSIHNPTLWYLIRHSLS